MKKTSRSALSAVLAVLGIAAAFPAPAAPAVGTAAPDFTLPAASGASGPVALKDVAAKGKGAVIIFVSTRCPYSNAYVGRMNALAKAYAAKGIAVLGINSNKNEPVAEIADHSKKNDVPFPILKDDGNKVADAYGANHTPEAFLIDAKGMLVYHGRIDESQEESSARSHDLQNAINALLAGKPVPVAETKAFGCSIKRV
ncbi:MAG TPA: thioredoxin family protein [Thermoanaerobaculia bacterium]|nr:thioredoxin family protein [Thermoanaerobaculia bacterium]